MTSRAHALLSASGAGLWTVCAAAPNLCEKFEDEESKFASEGNTAHAIANAVAKQYRDGVPHPEVENPIYDKDMIAGAARFLEQIREIVEPLAKAGKPFVILLEQRLDYSQWVPEGFGTGDCVIISLDTMWLLDYKYGKGIKVFAENNPQLKLYGLGGYNELSFAFEGIKKVVLLISQPRLDHFDKWELPLEDLLAWGEAIKGQAQKAFHLTEPTPADFVPGEHCSTYFCRARHTCAARAEFMLSQSTSQRDNIRRALVSNPNLLTEVSISRIYPLLDQIIKWAQDLKAFALERAIAGVMFPKLKLVAGKSTRFIKNTDDAVKLLVAAGYEKDDILREPELRTLGDLEKLVGKKEFASIMQPVLGKSTPKPVLVAEDDPRPTWSAAISAEEDFT